MSQPCLLGLLTFHFTLQKSSKTSILPFTKRRVWPENDAFCQEENFFQKDNIFTIKHDLNVHDKSVPFLCICHPRSLGVNFETRMTETIKPREVLLKGFGAINTGRFNQPLRGFWAFQAALSRPLRGKFEGRGQGSPPFNQPLRGFCHRRPL